MANVDLVFKRPNPDAEREFEQLFARMNEMEARQIRESIAAQDDERGLSKQALTREPITRSFIMAAMAAFARWSLPLCPMTTSAGWKRPTME